MFTRLTQLKATAAATLVAFATLQAPAAMAQDVAISEEARSLLPESIRKGNKLNAAVTYQWPPFSYELDDGSLTGIDIELLELAAAKLGLEPTFTNMTTLPTLIGGVSSGRFHLTPSMGITAERYEVVEYVPYYKSRYTLLTPVDGTDLDPNDLCGHHLAATQGSSQVAVVEALSAACVDDGKPEITFDLYPQASLSQLAVASKRAEGFITSTASAAYVASLNPDLGFAEGQMDNRVTYLGILVGKSNTELRDALLKAFESAQEDGSYQAILDKYNVSSSALTREELFRSPGDYLALN